jgi:hypothetical protein
MPLDFGETKSMYVDRGQKEVSKILSDRYLQNFLQTDAMQRQAASLTAAPFEGDEALKTEVLQDTDAFLQAAATAGDYENMTTDIVRAAGNYQARVAPIQQNQKAWQEYQTQLDEQVAKGEVPQENAERLKRKAMMTYQGLQKDADGNVGGYFQGEQAATDPNIMKMLDEAVKGLKSSSGKDIKRVVGVDSEKGLLEIETEAGFETISMNQVNNIIDPIFADPKVRSFLTQSAELAQIDKTPDMLTQETNAHLQGQMRRMEQLQEELANTEDDEEKADIQGRIDSLTEGINQTKGLLDNQDLNGMARLAAANEMNYTEMQLREAMGAKYEFIKQTQSYKEFRDEMDLIQARKDEVVNSTGPITTSGEAREIPNPIGQNYEEVQATRQADLDSAFAIINFLETDGANLSEEALRGKNNELQARLQDVAVANAMLLNDFENNPPEVYDREEYLRLKRILENAQRDVNAAATETIQPGMVVAGLSPTTGLQARSQELRIAQKNMDEFLRGTGFEVSNPTITYSPEFATGYLPGFDISDTQNETIQKQLIAYWQTDGQTIFEPNSNKISTMDQRQAATMEKIKDESEEDAPYLLQDGDIPPAFEVISVGVSVSAPGVGGPIMKVTVKSTEGPTKGQTVSFTAPSSDINIPAYNDWLNLPSTQMQGFIDKMAMVGGSTSFDIPTTDADGENWTIKVSTGSDDGTRYAIFVDSDGKESNKFVVGSAQFADFANRLHTAFNVSNAAPALNEALETLGMETLPPDDSSTRITTNE